MLQTKSLQFYEEPPCKKIISDADIYIKQLVEKQKITNIKLEEQLVNSKEFTKGREMISLKNYIPGTTSLSDFQNTTKHLEYLENLQSAGLSEEDIQLLFDSLNGEEYLYKKHKNWERSLLQQHLHDIKKMVDKNEGKKTLSENSNEPILQKHDIVEHGLAIKPNSTETKLLKFALQTLKQNQPILPHPMNHIKEIEKQRFAHLIEAPLPSISKIRRKARKLLNRTSITKLDVFPENGKNAPSLSMANISKWDVTTPEDTKKTSEKKVYSCLPQNYYTIRNREIVKLNNNEIAAKGLKIASKKLSVEEIKALPKFQNYECGIPSNTLYIKNLSKNIGEEDLKHLFRKFHHYSNSYKVMKGKLRGQAFATFSDEGVAGQALEETNGTLINNKPVIIQYGHAKNVLG